MKVPHHRSLVNKLWGRPFFHFKKFGQNLRRQRSAGGSPGNPSLNNHDHHVLGILQRGKSRKPRAGILDGASPDLGHKLRRAGFSRHLDILDRRILSRSLGDHGPQAFPDRGQIFGANPKIPPFDRDRIFLCGLGSVFGCLTHSLNQTRPIDRPSIRHRRQHHGHLQRSHPDKSLSDGSVGCMAIAPFFNGGRTGSWSFFAFRHPCFDFSLVGFFPLGHPILHPFSSRHGSRVFPGQHGFSVRSKKNFLPKPNALSHGRH